jgi:two-component system sensor histidine kinase/response regulator
MNNKVLIVDDNPKNLQVVATLLAENNYQVEVALDGKGAITWMDKKDFDVILLDVMMPGMNGFETCEKIKDIPKCKDIPIIFLTARHDVEGVSEGFEKGGVDYITKPFNHQELLARINTHIELKKSREKLADVNKWLSHEIAVKSQELTIANNQLTKANEELKKLDKAKSDFLNSISLEIRTPLNGIVGSMNLLKMNIQDEYVQEIIALLDSSVKNLEKYSFAALQIANLQLKGESQLSLTKVDLSPIIKSLIHNLIPKSQAKKIEVTFLSHQNEALVHADYALMQDAIMALLNCSLSYTKEGNIDIELSERESDIQISIIDTGNLFDGEEVEHFFGSLKHQNYQLERNNAMELYLAKMIILLHKGSLEFKNLSDKRGTITTIHLPKFK